jgi:uncharacterized protein
MNSYQDPAVVDAIVRGGRRVAVVGLSADPGKASHQVARYLIETGWEVIPVNPNASEVLGRRAYPDLASIPGPLDLVDIFRPPSAVGPVVDEAIAVRAKAVWQQLGIVNAEADERARKAGLLSVADLCLKIELQKRGS